MSFIQGSNNWIEWERRTQQNIAAIEKLSGKPVSEKDQMAVGIMVYNIMKSEQKAKK